MKPLHEPQGHARAVAGLLAWQGHGKGRGRDGVDGGKPIAPDSNAHAFEGVHGPQGSWRGLEVFGFPGLACWAHGFDPAARIESVGRDAPLVRRAGF
ncbi:hypothetical protein [Methylothermus subterraneus]